MRRWILALALVFGGCIGVPQPEPPSLDPSGVVLVPGNRGGAFEFEVAPGSIEPAVGDLWVIGLDDTLDPLLLPVREDGGVSLFEMSSARIRMQVRGVEPRERPFDFVRDGVVVRLDEPSPACLQVPLEVEVGRVQVGMSVNATLEVINDCAEDVPLTTLMRRASDLSIVDAPSNVSAGTVAEITVRLQPTALGPREEVLLLNDDAPTDGRRAVTLFGRGLP